MLQTLSADGDTNVVTIPNHTNPALAGQVHIHLSGTFGGGTFTLKFEDEGGTYRAITDAAYTSATDQMFTFKPGTRIKGTLSGATSPSLVVSIR